MIGPVPLFHSLKERLFGALLIGVIFLLSLGLKYYDYQKLASSKLYHTKAKVLSQYKKNGHWVLKLQTPKFTFYTSSKEDLKDLRDRDVAVMIIQGKKRVTFLDFLKGFYALSYIKKVLPKSRLYTLKEKIASQHKDRWSKELFSALFLATSISKDLREQLAALGLSHLVAISGFHLGIIIVSVSMLIYWLLFPLWQKWVPYLHLKRFALYMALACSFFYLSFLGEVPSLIRAFVLAFVGFILYDRGIKVLSFELLVWVVAIIIALFPHFLFKVGFWFSVAGVYFIYLYFHHFSFSKWIDFFALNIWVYVMMIPLVHLFFDTFSYYQLLSPLISLLFVIFYPLALVLHLLGAGGGVEWIEGLLHLKIETFHFKSPLWFVGLYLLVTILSIYKHRLIFIALMLNGAFFIHQVAEF